MFRPVLLLTLAASLVAGTAVADVYMYKDEKGNTQYTDKPPLLPAERLNVQSRRTDTVAAQERAQAEAQQSQASSRPAAPGNTTAEQKAAAEATAKDKADRCIKARDRYDRYMNSPKLYEATKEGERRYLTDEELDAARNQAKASMDAMCQ